MTRSNDRIPEEWERRIRYAARSKARAEARYRDVLAEALEAGLSQAGIARAAGITRSAINKSGVRRSIPEQDIPKIRQASKEGGTDDEGTGDPLP